MTALATVKATQAKATGLAIADLLRAFKNTGKLEGIITTGGSRLDGLLALTENNARIASGVASVPLAFIDDAVQALIGELNENCSSRSNRQLLICGNAVRALGEVGPPARPLDALRLLAKYRDPVVAVATSDAL